MNMHFIKYNRAQYDRTSDVYLNPRKTKGGIISLLFIDNALFKSMLGSFCLS